MFAVEVGVGWVGVGVGVRSLGLPTVALHIVVIRSDCCASPTHISRLSPPLANSNIAVGAFSWHRVHLKGRRQCVVPLWKVRGPQCWQRCVEGDALGHARVCRCRSVSGQRS